MDSALQKSRPVLSRRRRDQQTPLTPAQRLFGQQPAVWMPESRLGEPRFRSARGARPDKTRFASAGVHVAFRVQRLTELSPATGERPTKTAADPSAQLPMDLSALEMPNSPLTPPANGVPQASQSSANSEEPSHKRSNPNFNQASGKDYVVFEGTVLETTLVTRLNGDFCGPVICMLTNNIYSHDGQRLLIPAGTKVWVKPSGSRASARLAWLSSFIGSSCRTAIRVDLDQFQGLNQIGETGLKDQGQPSLPANLRRIHCGRRNRGTGRSRHKYEQSWACRKPRLTRTGKAWPLALRSLQRTFWTGF